MVIFTKEYATKNSVRYSQPNLNSGPFSIYVPNVWFLAQGINPKDAPETLTLTLEIGASKGPVFAHHQTERT